MNTNTSLTECELIDLWARIFPRSPHQLNALRQSDAELIVLPGSKSMRVAVTIDTISEEITLGLYRNPFTIGWVAVMASLSDLAAVGARPLWIVVSIIIDTQRNRRFYEHLGHGIAVASNTSGVYVLGGDTNVGSTLSLSVCSLGLIPSDRIMTRKGCSISDSLYISGRIGQGSALAISRFENRHSHIFDESFYRPVARLHESNVVACFASSCMDTSDGLLPTLHEITTINEIGVIIEESIESFMDAEAVTTARILGIPLWMMMAGPHGEFELVFTIPREYEDLFVVEAGKTGWYPIRIGHISDGNGIQIRNHEYHLRFDMQMMEEVMGSFNGSIPRIIESIKHCVIDS